MTKDEIRQRLEFYQDLGIKTIYRRSVTSHPATNPPSPCHSPTL